MWNVPKHTTHEGGPARRMSPEDQLKRSVLACMLWENTFYENGLSIADRISSLCMQVEPRVVADLALLARTRFKLRSVPLLLANNLVKSPKKDAKLIRETIESVIQRPDELYRFLDLYWKEGKSPIAKQVKVGLANAFTKFSPYQLAKYKGNDKVTLKDVMFLCHPTPKNDTQARTWRQLIGGFCKCGHNHYDKYNHINKDVCEVEGCSCTRYDEDVLPLADTWETAFTTGEGSKSDEFKKETWERLLKDNKLGPLALLKALRNMTDANVNPSLIRNALVNMNVERVLPFRFITAKNYCDFYTNELEVAMLKCLKGHEKLDGKTILLIDVSGSMDAPCGDAKYNRIDAASALAILLNEICEDVEVYTFSDKLAHIPKGFKGFELSTKINRSQPHSGTYLGRSLGEFARKNSSPYDRTIVITDEQCHDSITSFNPVKGYMINVASYKNGVDFGNNDWVSITGFSEAIIDFIMEYEKEYA